MKKEELIKAVSEKCRRSQIDCEAVIDALCETIRQEVCGGEEVSLVGVGKFTCKQREARTGINPRTLETIIIPSSFTPVFKAAKQFKDVLNK